MDIEVEAVDEIGETAAAIAPAGVDAPEYVLYGGKGGVGKTTMAAATALASARDGVATLVVSTDPAHSLSDTLAADIPTEPAQIREDAPLYGAEIDPETALSQGPLGSPGAMGPLEQLLGDDATEPLAGSMPGADEAAAISQLMRYMADDRFERVVVDTAPTGHTLRLLELPEMMDSLMGRVLSLRERMGGMMDGLSGMFGDDAPEEAEAAPPEDLRAFADRIEELRAVLRDPQRTDFRVVMTPEEMAVVETERLLDRLAAFDVPVGTVVVNRVLQAPSEVADVGEAFVAPNHEDCEFCGRRWDVQQRALASAQDVFRGPTVRRVPLFAEEVRGEDLLGVVGACLEA
jgi:arsenite-transporting ATPase